MINVQDELDRLSPTEREQAVKILQEYAKDGKSETMDKFLYEDYAEIPVDIHTFLHEEQYLGAALYDKEGRFTLYPYWEDMLAKVFPTNIDTNYHTAILTGGIGIGKSTVAVIGMIYALYRMLCLKDPQIHYGLQNNELISFVFVNMTLREAKGVAWAKFHNFVLQSEWFMQRGEISRSTILPTWKPYNKSIELYAASTPGMLQGRAVFSCLDGDTLILTTNGEKPIKDLVCQDINVISIDENGNQVVSDECTVLPTIETNEEYDIELEDGTILKCTPTHRFMLKDGTYKETQYLTEDDEFFGLNKNIKIKSIVKRILDEPKIFYDVINANPYNNFVVKCDGSYVVSHNCFVDEVNFSTTTIDIVKQKARAKKLVTEASNRLQSRFMKGVKNPTTLWLASSKASDQSYLDEFINEKKQIESKTTIIVDEPQWIVRNDKDSAVKFPVAIGNKFMENALLPKNADDNIIKQYTDRGYTILMVPIGYWENFNQDLDGSLRDIAGISVGASSNFISGSRLVQCVNEDFKNPFTKEIIKVGNDPNDLQQYYNFFDMSCVPKSLMAKPLFIHIDPSLSGDKTGLAGTWIIGKKGNDLHFQLAFSVSIEAPKGRQVSFEKTRNFVRWIRNIGFNVKGVSCFKGDTLISTPYGNKKIKDIKVGDIIYSFDDDKHRIVEDIVYNSINNGSKTDYVKIWLSEQDFIECTPEHPIKTQRGYVMAKDILETDLIEVDDKIYYKNKLLRTGLFIDNEWLNKYIDLVLEKKDIHNVYTEEHHIFPKALSKILNEEIDNEHLCNLVYSDHILAHCYLTKCSIEPYKSRAICAVNSMLIHTKHCKKLDIEEFENKIVNDFKFKLLIDECRVGRKHTEEEKLKISESNKKPHNTHPKSEWKRGNIPWNHGMDMSKIYSAEERKRIFGHPNFSWYNNGSKELMIFNGEDIPDGFIKGRMPKSQETRSKISQSMKGRKSVRREEPFKWYTDGVKSIQIYNNTIIPEGFVPGRPHFTTKDNFLNSAKFKQIDFEEYKNYFLNHSRKETCEHFNISVANHQKMCSYYNFSKPKVVKCS